MALAELMGRFTIGTSNDGINVGVNVLQVPHGDYYFSGYTGETQFLEALQATIRTVAGQANANVSRSAATGLTTFAMNTAVNVTFPDAALATLLGCNVNMLNADTYTSNRPPRYVWRPSRPMTDYPLDADRIWAPRSTTVFGRSKDGSAFSVTGNLLYDSTVRWTYLDEGEVKTPIGGTNYSDLEQWWTDVVHAGQPLRLIVDRTKYANTSCYVTAAVGSDEAEEAGSFLDLVGRSIQTWNGRWSVELPLIKWV